MTNPSDGNMASKMEDRELILERVFDAPRELVFQAFSEAEHLKRWFSPKGWSMPVCKIDFRPGGVWHFCMKCTDESQEYFGYESWGKVVYQEIDEPERIVYIDSFSDAEGNMLDGEKTPSSQITLTFIEENGKTKLISRTQYASSEALQSVLDMGMLQGVTETWDKLAALLEELQNQ